MGAPKTSTGIYIHKIHKKKDRSKSVNQSYRCIYNGIGDTLHLIRAGEQVFSSYRTIPKNTMTRLYINPPEVVRAGKK